MALPNQQITISAKVLKWARTTQYGKNIVEPINKLKITKEELLEWERSDPTITLSQLKKISKVYNRHISVLLLETPPVSLQPPKFRKLPEFGEIDFDKATFSAIRQAQEIQNTAVYLLNNNENDFLRELKNYRENIQILSDKIVKLLGISKEIRFKGKSPYEQLSIWKNLIESVGILVLEHSFPIKDMRAFALYDPVAPVIVLNSKDTDNAKIFSLFHELGHLIQGYSDIDEELNLYTTNVSMDEVYCNRLTALTLIPNDIFKEYTTGVESFDNETIRALAITFKVSTAVIWRKLYDNALIDPQQFNDAKIRLSNFDSLSNKKDNKNFKANKNTHLYIKIKKEGRFFIGEVLEAFNTRRITHYDVLDYIGIKADALPRLQRIMFS